MAFNKKYRDHKVSNPEFIGNVECNVECNVVESDFDQGDCMKLIVNLHSKYPYCAGVYPPWVSNVMAIHTIPQTVDSREEII